MGEMWSGKGFREVVWAAGGAAGLLWGGTDGLLRPRNEGDRPEKMGLCMRFAPAGQGSEEW